MESFNTNHPEKREGENFCTNARREDLRENPQFYAPPFRIGQTAYDIHGKEIKGMVPVFKEKK